MAENIENVADADYLDETGAIDVKKITAKVASLGEEEQDKVPDLLELLERFAVEKAEQYQFLFSPCECVTTIAQVSTRFDNPEHLQLGLGISERLLNRNPDYWSLVVQLSAEDIYNKNSDSAYLEGLNQLAVDLIDKTPSQDLHNFINFMERDPNQALKIGTERSDKILDGAIGSPLNLSETFKYLDRRLESSPEWVLANFHNIYLNYDVKAEHFSEKTFSIQALYDFYLTEQNKAGGKKELAKVVDLPERAMNVVKEQIAVKEAAHKKADFEETVQNIQMEFNSGNFEKMGVYFLNWHLKNLEQNATPYADNVTIAIAIKLKKEILTRAVEEVDAFIANRYQSVFVSQNSFVSGFNSLIGKPKDGRGRDGTYPNFSFETMTENQKKQLNENMKGLDQSDIRAMSDILEIQIAELGKSSSKKAAKEIALRQSQIESLKRDQYFMGALNTAEQEAKKQEEQAAQTDEQEDFVVINPPSDEDSLTVNQPKATPDNEIQTENNIVTEENPSLIINQSELTSDNEIQPENNIVTEENPPVVVNMNTDDHSATGDERIVTEPEPIIPVEQLETAAPITPVVPPVTPAELTPEPKPVKDWENIILKPAPKKPEVSLNEAVKELATHPKNDFALHPNAEPTNPTLPEYDLLKTGTTNKEGNIRIEGPNELTIDSTEFKHFVMIAKAAKMSGHKSLKLGTLSSDEDSAKKFVANLVLAGSVEGIEVESPYQLSELVASNPKIAILIKKQEIRTEIAQKREEAETGSTPDAYHAAIKKGLEYQLESGSIDARKDGESKEDRIERMKTVIKKRAETPEVAPRYQRNEEGKVIRDVTGVSQTSETKPENDKRNSERKTKNILIEHAVKNISK